MKREIIIPESEEQWLSLRRPDLTSTMMPALFELSPYVTTFELYHAKKNGLEIPFKTNDRMEKGSRMEGYAAQEIALKEGWQVEPFNEYIRLTDERIGSSFDFKAYDPKKKSWGIVEIKALDFFIHKENWAEEEIPADKEIQIRHQMMVAGDYEWGLVCAFTSIYDYYKYPFERDEEFEKGMLEAARQFWRDVDAGDEPQPDYYRDADVIAELYRNAGGDLVDRTGDNTFDRVVARFQLAKAEEKAFKEKKEAAKAEIHRMLAETGGAWSDKYHVKAGWTNGSPGREITEDMVGEVIGARAPYRQCLVKELNPEGENNEQ